MPQLDMSTWFTVIMSMLVALFILMQLKFTKHSSSSQPHPAKAEKPKHVTPWETKWTKFYLPHLLHL